MSICLTMIVKNEEHILGATLQNIVDSLPITDYCISDTGSTDTTVSIIETFFAEKQIPGQVVHDEWVNFGHNRNKSLENARRLSSSDYLLVFDADDCFCGNTSDVTSFMSRESSDVYTLIFGRGQKFHRSILFRRTLDAKYIGVLHEYLQFPPSATNILVPGDYFVDARTLGSRNKNPHKYRDDALMLTSAFYGETTDLRCRYCFYIAQSYFDAKMWDEAIEWYEKRLTLEGFVQEKYYSCLRLGYLYADKGNLLKAVSVWMDAFRFDPDRVEGLVYAMFTLWKNGHHSLVTALYDAFQHKEFSFHPDKVFIDPIVYNDNREFLFAQSAFHVGRFDEALDMTLKLVNSDVLQNDMTFVTVQSAYSLLPLLEKRSIFDKIKMAVGLSKSMLRLVENDVALTAECIAS